MLPAPPEPPGPGGGHQGGPKNGAKKVGRCPICGKPASEATRPFCSPRCRDVDLNRWLSGSYVIPGADDDTEDDK
ncbi:MAG: DNA gyrase inhibitor YacG [Bradyrhizobium sp.]|nr:DNA gyrase inhibitor YacG [Bradyrhizobium sp.]